MLSTIDKTQNKELFRQCDFKLYKLKKFIKFGGKI